MHAALFTKDRSLSEMLRPSLHESGFGMTLVEDRSTLETVINGQDILVLDVAAADSSLESILATVRQTAPLVGVIGVTVGNHADERIAAFRAGLDECVSRSFPAEEIALRAQALSRRTARADQAILRFSDVIIDRVARTVTRSGQLLRLTEREYRTLEYFIRNAGRVLSPAELCEQVWKFHFDPCSNVVQVFIMRLRKKLDDSFPAKLIQTVPREGYVLKCEIPD